MENNKKQRELVIRFYREELQRRYQIENVRRFEPFETVSDQQITQLREFFLEQIYPPPAKRAQLDEAFERLGEMLRSPKRMSPLMAAALSSMWRMGRRLPAAISAGRSTIDAFSKTRQLEALMIEEAERRGITAEDSTNRQVMLTLVQSVPERVVLRLIDDILSLFQALSNVKMLEVAAQFMEQCEEVMAKRPDLYTEADREGIRLGLRLLRGGLKLFLDTGPEHLPNVIAGIQAVEQDWYRKVKAEAAA